ncbi:hypothetical protein LY78DRAFT_150915 [Colletotrichum sublineola]|nr:hypothetical protein LY78DRAFT_150915 [Colletotrichum sublineola]
MCAPPTDARVAQQSILQRHDGYCRCCCPHRLTECSCLSPRPRPYPYLSTSTQTHTQIHTHVYAGGAAWDLGALPSTSAAAARDSKLDNPCQMPTIAWYGAHELLLRLFSLESSRRALHRASGPLPTCPFSTATVRVHLILRYPPPPWSSSSTPPVRYRAPLTLVVPSRCSPTWPPPPPPPSLLLLLPVLALLSVSPLASPDAVSTFLRVDGRTLWYYFRLCHTMWQGFPRQY